MSLLIKKILDKLKKLNDKTKVTSLNINDVLQNNWLTNGLNSIFKSNRNCVF